MGYTVFCNGELRDFFSGRPVPPPWVAGGLYDRTARIVTSSTEPEEVGGEEQKEPLRFSGPATPEQLDRMLRGMR